MHKNLGKNIGKKANGKYSQKLLGHAKQSTTDALKNAVSKRAIQKTATSQQNYSQKLRNRIIQKQLQMNMMKKNI